jgi:hypothetical protein
VTQPTLALPGHDAPAATGADVVRVLLGYRLPCSNEAALQVAIGEAFQREGLAHRREVVREADRIDFVVGRVGIECKVDMSVTNVTRQLTRYAHWPELDELVLVTTRGKHLDVPRLLNGKTVRIHIVRGLF